MGDTPLPIHTRLPVHPRRVGRRTLLSAAAAGGVGLTVVGGIRFAPSALASDLGGTISRSEVLKRAQRWVDLDGPYSQDQGDAYGDGDGHSYRPDCSGYVSMAWHLAKPAGSPRLRSVIRVRASSTGCQV